VLVAVQRDQQQQDGTWSARFWLGQQEGQEQQQQEGQEEEQQGVQERTAGGVAKEQ
jgi:hypothetical protein